jgi:hypothetical protein
MKKFTVLAMTFALSQGAILLSAPAMGRPRDDAMAGAYRCASIAASRTWLDCYYGAAQPVRGVLGIMPAPANQVALSAAPPIANGPTADSDIRDIVMSAAASCSRENDDRKWLDCYYVAAQPMRRKLGLVRDTAVPESLSPPPQQFGKKVVASVPEADHVVARMTSYQFDRQGWFTVTLDNGQVWRQLPGDTTSAGWKKPAPTYQVRITHGFFGSYNLHVQEAPGLYKVERVR